jgi:hypothetical protein
MQRPAPKALISWTQRSSLPPWLKLECKCRIRNGFCSCLLRHPIQQTFDGLHRFGLIQSRRVAHPAHADRNGIGTRRAISPSVSVESRSDNSPRNNNKGRPASAIYPGQRSTPASPPGRSNGSAIFMS